MRLFSRGKPPARVLTLAIALGTTGTLLLAPALLISTIPAHAQSVYPSADDAANAFVEALARNDDDALKRVLGGDFHRVIPTEGIGQDDIYQFLGEWSKNHQIVADPVNDKGRVTAHLTVGYSGWTLPIPLVRSGKGWRFDPPAGRDEMLTRRIGRNEHTAILTSLGYLDAQDDYRNLTQHYAQRFVSTPGQHNGLYWTTAPGEAESPLGPLAATMPTGIQPGQAYHGYHFRILTAQGPHAKGGARNYVDNGVLSKGVALIASPGDYGRTGVMSFIVNQDGQVYQKNLGPRTARAAAAITAFDPGSGWQAVQP
nr:DUF2950 domain-containing protein [Paraburkholderia aromaticivorans]